MAQEFKYAVVTMAVDDLTGRVLFSRDRFLLKVENLPNINTLSMRANEISVELNHQGKYVSKDGRYTVWVLEIKEITYEEFIIIAQYIPTK